MDLNYERAKLLHELENLKPENFDGLARRVFDYQLKANSLYAQFIHLLGYGQPLGMSPEQPFRPPALPIRFFKSHDVKSGYWVGETTFTSSGTTGQTPSCHAVRDLSLYLNNARKGFFQAYGNPADWCILALLPSYLERTGSSLVVMADDLIRHSKHSESGFFLNNFADLSQILQKKRQQQSPTLLLGVSFALLDFAEQCPQNLQGITIMETGGMKGRRRELTRSELHEILCNTFNVNEIHSEYGMTELFSQGYAKGGSLFTPIPSLRAFTTEINDPLCITAPGKSGLLNIIDLANVDTCAFISTEDIGRVFSDGQFEVLGRLDQAEMRGCNLMLE